MISLFKRNKFFLVFFIALLIMFPQVISKTSIANLNIVPIAMSIDKVQDEYEVSLQIIVPQYNGSFNESLEVVSAKGKTVRQALNQLSLHTGKRIGLGHCRMIVLNDEALENDIMKALDYVLRDPQVDSSCVLVNTNKSGKKLLEANKNLQSTYGMDSAKLLDFNTNYVYLEETSLDVIVRGYLSDNNAAFMSYIELAEDPSQGLDTSSGGAGGGGSSGSSGGNSGGGSDSGGGAQSSGGSGSGSDNKKVISNLGQISLLLDGKKVGVANQELMKGFFWLGKKQSTIEYLLEDYSDNQIQNGALSFVIKNRFVDKQYSFKDGKPHIKIQVGGEFALTEIVAEQQGEDVFISYEDFVTEKMQQKIKEDIENKVSTSIDYLKELKVDVIEVYRGYEKYYYKEWNAFLETLEDPKDFLSNVVFEYEVMVKSKI